MQESRECRTCEKEEKRKLLPKEVSQRASNFNQLVVLNIEDNIKCENKTEKTYILYIIDEFTKYEIAVFISNKKPTTVVEALSSNWVQMLGRCSAWYCNNGFEVENP